jgi:acetyltransferase
MTEIEETVQVLKKIFNARSVVLVGASSDSTKYGYMTLNSILRGGYEGQIYPVNPKGGKILGLEVYPSLSEVPGEPELLVVLVPANFVPGVLREAAQKGIKNAIILSGGFREGGRPDLEAEIAAVSREYGLRFAGPNIQGINYLPNKLCAMFFPVITTKGPLAIVSQSGTITAALSEWAADEQLGISAAVNLGNQVDLCESDYLDFFASDEKTKVVAMYTEGLQDGRRFLETIGRVVLQKPIAILKSGRTAAGQRSASSHTGSLAGSHGVFSAACRQFGAVKADDLETLYDSAKALATLKDPQGNRILIITTSGGAGTLASDEAESLGLVLPSLPQRFVEELKKVDLSPLAIFSNPFDLVSISADHFKKVALLADQFDVADVFLLNFGDPVVGAAEVAKLLAANIKASLAVSYLGGGEEEKLGRVEMHKAGIPVFPAPERAIRGIAAAVWAARYRRAHGKEAVRTPLVKRDRPRSEEKGSKFVLEPEAIDCLKQYQIPYPDYGYAPSAAEAVQIAESLGYPVVLKVVSPEVIHKSDAGGVVLGLNNAQDVSTGFERMVSQVKKAVPGASVEGALVCRQVSGGIEVIVGALEDPVFGATVMLGLGGIFTEVLKDVTFRIAPLERRDAAEMITELKGYPLLAGTRGQGKRDLNPLIDLLMSVSRLITDRPEVRELDLNPVRVFEQGLVALDVRLLTSA